jgi:hypothetical protein
MVMKSALRLWVGEPTTLTSTSPVKEGTFMIRLARFSTAMPGKAFELQAVLKEVAAVLKAVSGVETLTFASMGAQIGEMVNVSNYSSLADFEEKWAEILASSEYQAVVKKLERLVVPGSPHEHFLRQI